jgi:hypothetical protein
MKKFKRVSIQFIFFRKKKKKKNGTWVTRTRIEVVRTDPCRVRVGVDGDGLRGERERKRHWKMGIKA